MAGKYGERVDEALALAQVKGVGGEGPVAGRSESRYYALDSPFPVPAVLCPTRASPPSYIISYILIKTKCCIYTTKTV